MSGTAPRRPADAAPWRGVELLERAIGYTRGSLQLVEPGLMGAPTPCADWDLARLLAHMNDSLASLHEAGSTHQVRLDVVADRGTDPVAALRVRACRLLADWSALEERPPVPRLSVQVADREVTAPVLTSAGALEIAVHGWDVARACGAARPLPESLAAALLRLAPVLVTACDRPARFAVPLEPPAAATAGERLLAFLGRDPRAGT